MSDAAVADPGAAVDPAIAEAQAQVDALEAGKTTDAAKGTDKTPDPAPDKKTDPAPADPKKPADAPVVDYSKVILPKDATIDSAVLERTVAIAREQGLGEPQTQAVVDLINEQVAASRATLLESYQPGGAEWTKQLDAWKAQTLADESLGKTSEERTAAIQLGTSVLKRYAKDRPEESAGIMSFLNDSGLGEHPSVVKFFRYLGEIAAEQPIARQGASGSGEKSLAARMYPHLPES